MKTVAYFAAVLLVVTAYLTGGANASCVDADVSSCLKLTTAPLDNICANSASLQACASRLDCLSDPYNRYKAMLIIRGYSEATKFLCSVNIAAFSSMYACMKSKSFDPAAIIDYLYRIEDCSLYKTSLTSAQSSATLGSCGTSAGLLYARVASRIGNPVAAEVFADPTCKYVI
jgi:hypothetical protein